MRSFPILGTYPQEYVPWNKIELHEQQAQKNHGGQTLERLAERGGLTYSELLAVLEDRRFQNIDESSAKIKVLGLLERL